MAWSDGDAPCSKRGGRRNDAEGHIGYLTKRLRLTPAQRDSVEAIIARHKPAMDSVWRQVGPRFETIRDSISNDIRRQLTPEQQASYSEMIQRVEAERRGRKD